jgi:hypothetical protein
MGMNVRFSAQYAGRCGNCGEMFEEGEPVVYGADDRLVRVECCADPEGQGDPFLSTPEEIKVLPRGKTAADRCGKCFQVPASNGVCGCC